ncbi:MAG: hypothetical protein RR054_04735 [Clostridia bacterium]
MKNHQSNHEYYMNFETSRNRLFDNYDDIQNEDYTLDLNHPDGLEGISVNEYIKRKK